MKRKIKKLDLKKSTVKNLADVVGGAVTLPKPTDFLCTSSPSKAPACAASDHCK